ncbi:MAG: lipocalin family protein [Bacteroidota bacterium]|nr:lipocalin family protein [Bacteroidota bacterium]
MTKIRTLLKAGVAMLSIIGLSFFVSCEPDEPTSFDESLLYGKWVEGTVYERYKSDGTGYTWDTSDDVSEEEAQDFTWTLDEDQLVQIHIMEIGGNIPKTYTVTELNETNLTYKDDYGTTHNYTKVEE